MNRIRAAKPEEIEKIKDLSDLDDTCFVMALDSQQGVALAVVRVATEVDPVFFPEGFSPRMKLMFQRDIETVLSAKGVPRYYFNVHADEATMTNAMDTLGAQKVSTAPEFRFVKNL